MPVRTTETLSHAAITQKKEHTRTSWFELRLKPFKATLQLTEGQPVVSFSHGTLTVGNVLSNYKLQRVRKLLRQGAGVLAEDIFF